MSARMFVAIQPIHRSVERDTAVAFCREDAAARGCDMGTFEVEELQLSVLEGLTLEDEDTPFPHSEWYHFRWSAQLDGDPK